MSPFFFIAGLPRSRTAWLANLLTWRESFCFHEATLGCGSIGDLQSLLTASAEKNRYVGDSDPNLGFIPKQLLEAFPECRVVVVFRTLEECVDAEWNAIVQDGSMPEASKEQLRATMQQALSGLSQLCTTVPCHRRMMVRYEVLDNESVIRSIWQFCTPTTEFPVERYEMLRDLRVTQIMGKVFSRHPDQPFKKMFQQHATILEN